MSFLVSHPAICCRSYWRLTQLIAILPLTMPGWNISDWPLTFVVGIGRSILIPLEISSTKMGVERPKRFFFVKAPGRRDLVFCKQHMIWVS